MATGTRSARLREEQIRQLKRYHDKAYEHEVAHAKISTRNETLAITTTLLIGLLGVFSGTVWTVDMAEVVAPSSVIKWMAAVAGFLVAIVLAAEKAVKFSDEAKKHDAASGRFAKPRLLDEKYMAEGRFHTGLTQAEVDAVADGYQQALHGYQAGALNASARMLKKDEKRAGKMHWAEDVLPHA